MEAHKKQQNCTTKVLPVLFKGNSNVVGRGGPWGLEYNKIGEVSLRVAFGPHSSLTGLPKNPLPDGVQQRPCWTVHNPVWSSGRCLGQTMELTLQPPLVAQITPAMRVLEMLLNYHSPLTWQHSCLLPIFLAFVMKAMLCVSLRRVGLHRWVCTRDCVFLKIWCNLG